MYDAGRTVVARRDLSRHTEKYATTWDITQKTPEEVQRYLTERYGKLPEPVRSRPIHTGTFIRSSHERTSQQRRIVPEEILSKEMFLAEKSQGMSYPKIAKKYGLSERTISRLVTKWGLVGMLQ